MRLLKLSSTELSKTYPAVLETAHIFTNAKGREMLLLDSIENV